MATLHLISLPRSKLPRGSAWSRHVWVPSRLCLQHEGEEAHRFRFLGQERDHQPCQEQGFLGQIAAHHVGKA